MITSALRTLTESMLVCVLSHSKLPHHNVRKVCVCASVQLFEALSVACYVIHFLSLQRHVATGILVCMFAGLRFASSATHC